MDGQLLSRTFVELTDTMVAGFDVIDFLHVLTGRSVELLDVSAAGLLLADPRGDLRVVAASSEAARLLELFALQSAEGPCLDASARPPVESPTSPPLALAPVRRRRPPGRLRGRAGPADAAARPGHRRAEPFRGAPGPPTPGPRHRPGPRRRRDHQAAAPPQDAPQRGPERAVADCAEQPGYHRAGQGYAGRAGRRRDERGIQPLRDLARSRNRRLSDLARAFADGTETLTSLRASRPRQRLPGIGQAPRPPRPGSWRTP